MEKKDDGINVTDKELSQLATIYAQLQEPDRTIFIMGGNLLLASQKAKDSSQDHTGQKAG